MENSFGKIVFISNYFNHHQKPICDALFKILGEGRFYFIETTEITKERKKLGYKTDFSDPYVVKKEQFSKEKNRYKKLINEADVVIVGSASKNLIKKRKKEGKITLLYSERLFKRKFGALKTKLVHFKLRRKYTQEANTYVLCASAYARQDFEKLNLYKNKMLKWGYFPNTTQYDSLDDLISKKTPNSIIWVARFIDWKHPEVAIEVARRLKQDGYNFQLNMIGNGVMIDKMRQLVEDLNLGDSVHILGSMKPEEVREHMERSEIHMFTSDRQEGWGAVLNESMNSCCIAVVNKEIGSAPYLIDDKTNGFLYETTDELYMIVKSLLDNKNQQREIAKNAYQTIVNEWSYTVAAKRLIELSACLLNGDAFTNYETGPLSKE